MHKRLRIFSQLLLRKLTHFLQHDKFLFKWTRGPVPALKKINVHFFRLQERVSQIRLTEGVKASRGLYGSIEPDRRAKQTETPKKHTTEDIAEQKANELKAGQTKRTGLDADSSSAKMRRCRTERGRAQPGNASGGEKPNRTGSAAATAASHFRSDCHLASPLQRVDCTCPFAFRAFPFLRDPVQLDRLLSTVLTLELLI